MTKPQIFQVPDRGVVALTGPDALTWLDNLVSNDMSVLQRKPLAFTGLLSPQGKVLFEFFVFRASDGVLLETSSATVDGLIKRLRLYKLRANIELHDVTADWAAVWGPLAQPMATVDLPTGTIHDDDPRAVGQLWRGVCPRTAASAFEAGGPYLAERVRLGVAEAPADYTLGDILPHEANFDLQGGVSFTKGCFVGQEVVSRMQNKTVVRKRVVRVSSTGALTPGAEIMVGAAVIGKIGSVAGHHALALLRLDRAAEAKDTGGKLEAAGLALDVDPDVLKRYRQSLLDRPVIDL